MSDGLIPPKFRHPSGSQLIEAIAKALSAIKNEDGLTDRELGTFLGKPSQDSGKAYRTGFAEMPVTAFLRGCALWNGRFANAAFALIGMKLEPLDAVKQSDQACVTTLLSLAAALSAELEKDHGKVSEAHLQAHRAMIEQVGHVIDGYRDRLKLRSVA